MYCNIAHISTHLWQNEKESCMYANRNGMGKKLSYAHLSLGSGDPLPEVAHVEVQHVCGVHTVYVGKEETKAAAN